jgi:PhnB protein
MAEVKPIPDGFTSVTPYYFTKNTESLLKFLEQSFGAQVLGKMPGPNGKGLAHATAKIGNAMLMFSDLMEGAIETKSNTYLYVDDPDAAIKAAEAAGGKILQPATDQFWGDRWGVVEDQFGNQWQVAKHVKDIKPEDMKMPDRASAKTP